MMKRCNTTKADIELSPHILYQKIISSKQALLIALQGTLPDIILSDHSLPAFNLLEALQIVKQKDTNLPFIHVTGNTSEEFGVSVIKGGADDHILKDRKQRIPTALLKALEKSELKFVKEKTSEAAAEGEEIGNSTQRYSIAQCGE